MNLIWNIIRKDLRRDRWAFLAWMALFLAQIALGVFLLNYEGVRRDWVEWIQVSSGLLVMVQVLAGYILVARLVLADPLLGTDVFWATRPISRRRLLLAKAGAALLMFAVVPVVLLVPWWLGCGFTLSDTAWMVVEKIGWQLLMIAPAFLVASLTDEIGRVLLWTLVLFIVGLLVIALLINTMAEARTDLGDRVLFYAVYYTRTWLSVLLVVVCAGGVAAHQYLTGRHQRSILLTVVAIIVIFAPQTQAALSWAQAFSDLPQRSFSAEFAGLPDQIKVEVGDVMPSQRPGVAGQAKPIDFPIVTEFYYQGVPPGLRVSIGPIRQTWQWAGGTTIRRSGYDGFDSLEATSFLRRTTGLPEPAVDAETRNFQLEQQAKQEARRVARGLPAPRRYWYRPPSHPGERDHVYAIVPPAFITRAAAEPPAYKAEFEAVVTRQVVLADLPIQVGAEGGRDSVRVRLRDITENKQLPNRQAKEPEVKYPPDQVATFLVTAPTLRVNGLWLVDAIVPNRMMPGNRGEFCTVNPRTGDIRSSGYYAIQSTRRAQVAGVVFSWNAERLRPALINRNGEFVYRDPAWLEHSRVMLVTSEAVARFKRTVRLDRQGTQPNLWVDYDPKADVKP